jgi:NAD(P)-dependent dehydrogenase (short-subunit alcohol dehydrogenase family)
MDIKDKVVWITGGTAGMGLATARLLLDRGAKVMVTARDAERGAAVASELGPDCLFAAADVTDSTAMQAAVAAAVEKWGRLDVLFGNAGGGATSWCLPMVPTPESVEAAASGGQLEWAYTDDGPATLESFRLNIEINLIGQFDAARLAAWEMRNNEPNADGERGVIIFTSSISATKRHSPGFNCGYAAGKAGLLGLTKEIACNLAPLGIRVNAIIPGFFDTDIVQNIGFLKESWLDAQIFPRKAGDPTNIGRMVAQIVENPFINNATIEVTAGFASTRSQA